jgi:S-DNA-T family DNA segregation ATPase FtsK/SpoIIIE
MRAIRRKGLQSSHWRTDAGGVLLLAASLFLFLSLFLPDTGVLGGTIATLLRGLFGAGAWVCPILPAIAGVALLFGKTPIRADQVALGLGLVYLSALGFLAKPSPEGDFLDPFVVAQTGGYVGAVTATAFRFLLGSAMSVGLGAVATVGAILCVNTPVRAAAESVSNYVAALREKRKERERRKRRRPTRAVVRMPAEESEPEQETPRVAKDTPAPDEKPKTRKRATLEETESAQAPPSIAVEEPTPKEGYELPPLALLTPPTERSPKRNQNELQKNREILEGTLEEFGIEAEVVEFAHGPTLTRYEIVLGPGVRVSRIKSLADNIAMSLAAHHVRVEAPIPGKAAIGIEVPNAVRSLVTLREVAENEQFLNHPSKLAVCLGKDVAGQNVYADLTQMPHLLIGGATNSGKSIALATLITSLLMRNTPKDLRLVLLDPKRVELTLFDGIPHLMCPVVKDVEMMAATLRLVWKEMDDRYDLLSEVGARNIEAYNQKVSFAERLPYVVVVIDELADLMIQAASDVEASICRLAQLARATGIHLVIATQRPSVDVITGTIKANISSRIAFAVSSQVDSRTILDCGGAENLIGKGDMLFLPIGAAKPQRVQGCYVSEAEIHEVCEHWRKQAKPHYSMDPVAALVERQEARMGEHNATDDPLYADAVRWVAERGEASTSMLQRRFKIGFQRASRLLDTMEEHGVVGPRDGPRPREVLISPLEAEELLGEG